MLGSTLALGAEVLGLSLVTYEPAVSLSPCHSWGEPRALIVEVFSVGPSLILGESSEEYVYQTSSHKSRETDTNLTFEFGHACAAERRVPASISRRFSRAPLLPPNVSQVYSRAQTAASWCQRLVCAAILHKRALGRRQFFVGFDHPTAAGGGHTKRPPFFPCWRQSCPRAAARCLE